jgi:rhamnogalacturonan endolyase
MLSFSPLRVLFVSLFLAGILSAAPRQRETLDRGLVAVARPEGGVFLSWRLLGNDEKGVAFNIYREVEKTVSKLNAEPLTGATCLVLPEEKTEAQYSVRPVLGAKEGAPSAKVAVWRENYLEVPIDPIPDYAPGDASVGDLDGDGQYELVVHQRSRARDNSFPGVTGTPVLDAYRLDGTRLWRIDLGINIRDGEHYTQFLVYDFDGDGKAELVCKTADGTKDGKGTVLGDPEKDYRIRAEGNLRDGRILSGPEFLTVFDGLTGAALKTVDYLPGRDPIDGWGGIGGNGGNDNYGNRCDRFLACVAYLDGKRPSLVMCRGVYGRTVLAAWDWRDGKLTSRWVFDSGISYPPFRDASPYSGMGGHSLGVADVDGDGRDEIVYQSMVVDDDGKGLYSTGLRHGDSMHVGDFDPERPGLEVLTVHENEGRTVRFGTPGAVFRDARDGRILWSHSPGVDVAKGLIADIDPRHPGCEAWGGPGGLRDVKGNPIGPAPRTSGFAIWWDGDLLRELLRGSVEITKWDWKSGREESLFDPFGQSRGRGRRGSPRVYYPNLVADILGDWREELILPAPDGKSLRIYTTTIPTEHRLTTLMHDPQYRLQVAAQNVVYNTPAHPGYFLGEGMK